MIKKMKPGRLYFIINTDEPYAEKIYEILKKGQIAQGKWPEGDIGFEDWKKSTIAEMVNDEVNGPVAQISTALRDVLENLQNSGIGEAFIDAFKGGIQHTIDEVLEDLHV